MSFVVRARREAHGILQHGGAGEESAGKQRRASTHAGTGHGTVSP